MSCYTFKKHRKHGPHRKQLFSLAKQVRLPLYRLPDFIDRYGCVYIYNISSFSMTKHYRLEIEYNSMASHPINGQNAAKRQIKTYPKQQYLILIAWHLDVQVPRTMCLIKTTIRQRITLPQVGAFVLSLAFATNAMPIYDLLAQYVSGKLAPRVATCPTSCIFGNFLPELGNVTASRRIWMP